MAREEIEDRGPIHALVPEPVSGPRHLMPREVMVERPQQLPHRAGLGDRHVVVGITMQDVDPVLEVVGRQHKGVDRHGGPLDQALDVVGR